MRSPSQQTASRCDSTTPGRASSSFFDVGFGAREGVAFLEAEGFADAVLRDFVQAVEIDDADGRGRLRGG